MLADQLFKTEYSTSGGVIVTKDPKNYFNEQKPSITVIPSFKNETIERIQSGQTVTSSQVYKDVKAERARSKFSSRAINSRANSESSASLMKLLELNPNELPPEALE